MAKAMKQGLIARKRGMTQVFGADGNIVPATVLEAGPCTVVQVKTQATDGYDALQLGFEPKRKNVPKPMAGHFKKAGVAAVQLFDSWVGALGPDDYRAFVLPHTRAILESLTPGVPAIHFGTGTAGLLEALREAGGDVIGLDWRVALGDGWRRVGHDVAVQGNLDPAALFASPAAIRRRAAAILAEADGRPGHVFNLGHGVLPGTPVDHVRALVDAVHELSQR